MNIPGRAGLHDIPNLALVDRSLARLGGLKTGLCLVSAATFADIEEMIR